MNWLLRQWHDFLGAVQFLTRVPVPSLPYKPDSLPRAVVFFPIVGLLLGAAAAMIHLLLAPHLPRLVTALLVVIFLVLITGCFHEDGLADTADGFGGGWDRSQVLLILKDSRIGSYGSAALSLSLIARTLLLASIPLPRVAAYLIAAHVLCRWTTLPLSFFLAPARKADAQPTAGDAGGQGARLARLTTRGSLVTGSLLTVVIVVFTLHIHALSAIAVAIVATAATSAYYQHRIGGVTGDCFGATNQLTEILVYLTGVWIA